MRKPVSQLERYLAGESGETQDTLPVVIALVVILVVVVAAVL